jgi:hypothetical protein
MDSRALTLTEVIVTAGVILLIALFVSLVGRRYYDRKGAYTRARTQDAIASIATAVELYRADSGAYPVPVEYFLSPAFLTSKKAKSKGLTREKIVKQFGLGKPDGNGHYTITRPGLWPDVLVSPMRYIRGERSLVDPFSLDDDPFYRYMVYSPPGSDVPTTFIVVGCGPNGVLDLPIYPSAAKGTAAPVFDPAAGPPTYGLPRPLDSYDDYFRIGGIGE